LYCPYLHSSLLTATSLPPSRTHQNFAFLRRIELPAKANSGSRSLALPARQNLSANPSPHWLIICRGFRRLLETGQRHDSGEPLDSLIDGPWRDTRPQAVTTAALVSRARSPSPRTDLHIPQPLTE